MQFSKQTLYHPQTKLTNQNWALKTGNRTRLEFRFLPQTNGTFRTIKDRPPTRFIKTNGERHILPESSKKYSVHSLFCAHYHFYSSKTKFSGEECPRQTNGIIKRADYANQLVLINFPPLKFRLCSYVTVFSLQFQVYSGC